MRLFNILPIFLTVVADASSLHPRQGTSSAVSVSLSASMALPSTSSSASAAVSSAVESGANSFASSPTVQSSASSTPGASASKGIIPSSSSNVTQAAPAVTIYPDTSSGQPVEIIGTRVASAGQDVYLGIPFARPPIDGLRFTPPESYTYNSSTFQATTAPPACMQDNSSNNQTISEDCLYLNVYSPAGSNATNNWLPVMVWVYGGSFTSGSINTYPGTAILAYAEQTERPFIFVAINYRLGVFGWGTGSGFAENNAANLGLRDIMKGLSWVQENIWAFGGNPDQVTVFGESAGAISISLLFLNQSTTLFSAAIMESGAQSTAPIGPTNTTWEDAYNALLATTNCTSPSDGNATQFQCLKELPANELLQGQLAVRNQTEFAAGFIYAPTIDGDLITDSPHTLLSQGQFANKPFITGNNKDEGTRFIPTSINSTLYGLKIIDLAEPIDPSNETLAQLISLYPDNPSLGSPFGTGNETFGLDPSFKQFAALYGDGQFQSLRRYFLQQANQYGNTQTWTYQFEQLTPGAPGYLGSYHGSEVIYVFGAANPNLAATAGSNANYTEADQQLSQTMMNYWINFAYYHNPNGDGVSNNTTGSANTTYWPSHDVTANNKNMLRLKSDNITVFQDDYREQQMDFFLDHAKEFNARRRWLPT
ncbi:carboxylesterase [Cryptococcus deuterogattii LA55]|nr:carboxylesterase [Cryptococcus deuterogattii LA55]KIR89844.1 carboxylesterase [Cryptococcus deuterogattii CBS 10090]